MPLSDSDMFIARQIADSPRVRSALERMGPVPENLTPLAEAYVHFVRYAPTTKAEPPPAVWAMMKAHEKAAGEYVIFRREHPDLDWVVQAASVHTKRFLTESYQETRLACLRGEPDLDKAIWPEGAAALSVPKFKPAPYFAWLGVAWVVGLASLVLDFPAIGCIATAAVVLGLFAAFWRRTSWIERQDRADLPMSDEVVRTALSNALEARTSAGVRGRRAGSQAAGEMAVGAIGVGAMFAALFDW